ncbi:PLP-dependent aminotransferase family protein [Microlunatus elymi]|uniref:PLP-dependent aminotransferase family protein n=1 Tax=Microlunatus elymi TaxID=2596828 RepID=A0A516PTN6_9ACTN|nr:PLP-dependent aminotransferase family protein [Microlunatus elymi]QDP94556.1 PLP-dependent aminotransferase family protein [Microlunatus elymi]
MPALSVTLDRSDGRPLGTQLADQIRDRIVRGLLPGGERLPSSRALAAELVVARAVTEQAYGQLVAEGWLQGWQGSGTFVAGAPPLAPARPRRRGSRSTARELIRLDTGTPWIDPRQAAAWRRAWRDVSVARPPAGYDDPRGIAELRTELAERLGRLRGIVVDAEQILITTGTTDGFRQLLTVLPEGPVALEDPGYRAAAETIRAAGRTLINISVGQGADPAGTVATYVTPAHQHPLGATMPAAERLRLLAAARAADSMIIEDDYDSEFRYDVAPVPALASLDQDQVCYLGTASKSVAPSLRLGWMVPPPDQFDALLRRRTITHEVASWPVQRAFLSLLRDGYLDKIIRSARRVYADRAARVVGAMTPYGDIVGPVAGMYVTIRMSKARAAVARAAARTAGFDVPLLADYCRSTVQHGVIIGFGGITDDQLDTALTAITGSLDG